MGYVFRPNKSKKTSSSSNKANSRYLKIILITQAINLGIVIAAFFGFILIFGNINYVWGLFRAKEVYKEDNAFKPTKPYLQTNTEYTKETKVNLEGTSESGSTVTLFKEGQKVKDTVADNNNKFYFGDIEINANQDKKTSFYVVAKSKQGVESDKSNLVDVVFDKTTPKFSIKTPEDGQKISDFSRTLQVTGSTEVNTQVLVNGRTAAVNQNNDFSAQIRLEEGDNTITVEVVDKAGNKSKQTVTVKFEKKSEN